jgi:hypothetical protein
MKKEKERKKREEKEAEMLLKKEREMECQSEVHLRRLQQRMAETEARQECFFVLIHFCLDYKNKGKIWKKRSIWIRLKLKINYLR